jgi:hypothetical protein
MVLIFVSDVLPGLSAGHFRFSGESDGIQACLRRFQAIVAFKTQAKKARAA